jgi:hydroxypyruvate isomerase
VLFNAPPGDWDGGERGPGLPAGREAEFRAAIASALRYAEALACPRVHVMAGLVPRAASARAARHLRRQPALGRGEAAKQGVDLLLEPINTRDIPRFFLNRQDHAHELVARSARPTCKVQMDLYHCQIVEGDVAMKIRQYLPTGRVGHFQIAGVPQRHEPDVGELNYRYLFGVIDEVAQQCAGTAGSAANIARPLACRRAAPAPGSAGCARRARALARERRRAQPSCRSSSIAAAGARSFAPLDEEREHLVPAAPWRPRRGRLGPLRDRLRRIAGRAIGSAAHQAQVGQLAAASARAGAGPSPRAPWRSRGCVRSSRYSSHRSWDAARPARGAAAALHLARQQAQEGVDVGRVEHRARHELPDDRAQLVAQLGDAALDEAIDRFRRGAAVRAGAWRSGSPSAKTRSRRASRRATWRRSAA